MLSLMIRFTAACFLLLGQAAEPARAERAFKLDDMLRVQGFGMVAFDPSGRWLVYEQIRPYDQYQDYSYRTYAFGKSGHQLWVQDLLEGGAPKLLPGLDPKPHSYIQSFSRGGRYLSLMQYDQGDLRLGVYDFESLSFRAFGLGPAVSRSGDHVPVWVSDEELVYAALPPGAMPAETSIRAQTGTVLTQAWADARRGDVATAHEVRTGGKSGDAAPASGSLVLANARTGNTTTLAEGLFADLRLSPEGSWLAGLAVAEGLRSGTAELFNLRTGERVRPAPGFEMSPYSLAWQDECRLAGFAWRERETMEEGRFIEIDHCRGTVTPYLQAGIELVSERERGLMPRPERAVPLEGGLAVFARPAETGETADAGFRPYGAGPGQAEAADWYLLDTQAAPRRLTGSLPHVSAMPWGMGQGAFLVGAGGEVYHLGAGNGPERLKLAPGSVWRVHSEGSFAARSGVMRPDPGRDILLSGHGELGNMAVVLDGASGAVLAQVRAPTADARLLAASADAGAALFRVDDGLTSELRLSFAEGKQTVIARINQHLAEVDAGTWVPVTYDAPGTDTEGRRLTSCVLMPPGTRPGDRLAVVVNVYPGIEPACGARITLAYADPHAPYLWAGLGYAYVRLSLPSDLLRTPEGPLAGMPALLDAGLDALIQEGIADKDRMALTGFSQGGVVALYGAAHTARFQAVIAMNSFANLLSHYFGGAGVYTYTDGSVIGQEAIRYEAGAESEFGLGASPFGMPERYLRSSPVLLAPDMSAPIMLVHSDFDAFPMSQFDEMFGALKRAGKEARYVRYWGEGHGPSSPANIRDLWRRMTGFLEEKGVVPGPGQNP